MSKITHNKQASSYKTECNLIVKINAIFCYECKFIVKINAKFAIFAVYDNNVIVLKPN